MERTIVSIDVGTTKVCTLVGKMDEGGALRIVGVGVVPSKGLRKGVVVNVNETTEAIAASVEKAQRISGHEIERAHVGVAGAHISSFNSRGVVAVSRGHSITQHRIRSSQDSQGVERYWVDSQGIVLPSEGELEAMLLIQDLRTGPFEVGDRIDPEVVRSALALRRFFPETAVLQYSEGKGLILHQADYPVYLGAGDVAEKIAILNALLQELAAEGIKPAYVDLRFKESPSYSY